MISKKNVYKIIFFTVLIISFVCFEIHINTNEKSSVPNKNETLKVISNFSSNDTENTLKDNLYNQLSEDVDLNYYREHFKNNDIIGRLEIPNVFNVFITKSKDNKYYLKHSIRKKYDIFGTEFMDYRTSPTGKQINIYGHNSRFYKTSFKKIEKFLNKKFYLKNQYIIFQHDKGHRIYKIFAIKEVFDDFEHMLMNVSDDEFASHIDNLRKDAVNQTDIEYDNNSNIIILQTCSYSKKNAYYIIIGIEI